MTYNKCNTCHANDGRAGLLINDQCKNCHDTETTGIATIHQYLKRTDEEVALTLHILSPQKSPK